ncbi:MAG: hypothetical protein PHW11_04425 [Anaerolineaceae bacterium]|nr:hypothetical protein [Anaerolineaceae bacterium]MDD4042293.1 hypothetical protein [Anaerolineaceae bacterium]MDD4578623.1 hypothetical protein [Anaerolineaceae bacterium]
MTEFLQSLPVYIALLAALLNLVRRQWSLNLVALVVQFICVFPPLLKILPLQLALIHPFTGLMVTLILYLTLLGVGGIKAIDLRHTLTSGELFRGAAGVFLLATLRAFLPQIHQAVFPLVSIDHLFLSLGLILIGLLQMGTIREPFYLAIGILTFLSGFELLYSGLEFSFLLEALLVAVNLLLAIVGSFFIIKDSESEAA